MIRIRDSRYTAGGNNDREVSRPNGGCRVREMKAGTLYIVATPIGNLEDITIRALRVLKEADLVACEDTRRARILLTRHTVRAKLVSYYGAKEKEKARELMRHLAEGRNIALISEAGMPGISDPGSVVVREAISAGIPVVPIPGPSAAIASIAASGLPSDRFVFEGFLPRKVSERKTHLIGLSAEKRTMIFYESPGRLVATLVDIETVMGDRRAVVVRELTKIHEEFLRGTIGELIKRLSDREIRGEIVIVLEGCGEEIDWKKVDIPSFVLKLQEEIGIDRKSAIKLTAQLSGIARSIIYKGSL